MSLDPRAEAIYDRLEALADDAEKSMAQNYAKALLSGGDVERAPSKAHLIARDTSASYTGTGPDFASAVWLARSRDHDEQQRGKAMLDELGSRYQEMAGKATLGDSDAAGGYLVPRITADVSEATSIASPVRYLLN